MSWPAVDALDRERTLLIQPVSPLEEHGPHLPLRVDVTIAEFFAERMMERFSGERPEWNAIVLPSIVLGCNAFSAPGTISVRASAMRDVIYDVGASFASHGFRYLFLASGHGALGHLVAMEEAAHDVERRFGMKMVSLSSKLIPEVLDGRLWHRVEDRLGRELSAAERAMLKGDTHGGLLETSFMLKLRPDLVGEFQGLEPYDPSRFVRLLDGYATKEGRAGYVGYPAAASAEFGGAALEAFVDIAYERMLEAMENPDPEPLSMVGRIPMLRPGWRRSAKAITGILAAAGGAALVAFLLGKRLAHNRDDTSAE